MSGKSPMFEGNVLEEVDLKSFEISKDLLNSISLSNSSAGVLCKWIATIDNCNYYFKSGTLNSLGLFSDRQPQAELMAYRLGLQLGFDFLVPTFTTLIHFEDSEKYAEQDALISFTKSFLANDESYVGIHRYFTKKELSNNLSNLYSLFTKRFPFIKTNLDSMLVFDFIILNTDRHLNNFGIIEKENYENRLSPLFDNGLSLLSNFSDEELAKLSDFFINKKVKVKPFNKNSFKQIELVDFDGLSKNLASRLLNVSIDWDLVFDGLDLSNLRKSKIKNLVEGRLTYVKTLLSKTM